MATESDHTAPAAPKPLLETLRWELERGQRFVARPDLTPAYVRISIGSIRRELRKLLGDDSPVVQAIHVPEPSESRNVLREQLRLQVQRLAIFLAHVDAATQQTIAPAGPPIVFFGHGRSPVWREVKDFVDERLHLRWEEFNREAVAGTTTFARLEEMLSRSHFALLVMTAEDEHADAKLHARENVVHEVGLFQGHLGPKKAIILQETTCAEFSNIHGLSTIRFPSGHVSAAFEEVRRVLEREGLVRT